MNKFLTIYLFNKKQNSVLILLAILSLVLMLLRVKITHDIYLLFLIWNLFLGYIPYFFSSKLKNTVPGYFCFYLLFLGWLLFLPNAFFDLFGTPTYLTTQLQRKHSYVKNDNQLLILTMLLSDS